MAAFFTEFVRINRDAVDSLLDPELERSQDTSLWLDHIGDLELVSLWDFLPNSTASDDTLMEDLISPHDGEILVFSTPDEFVNAIRDLNGDEIMDTAKKWSALDEMSHWELNELAGVIRDLQKFVQDAKTHNQIVVQVAEI